MPPGRGRSRLHPGRCLEGRPSPRLPRGSPGGVSMLASLQGYPQTWRETFTLVASGFTWVLDLSKILLDFVLFGDSAGEIALKWGLIVLPSFALVAGMLFSMAALYTLPFRSGRGGFMLAVVMSWWDWLRMTWLYWAGLFRFGVLVLGWAWNLLKLSLS